MLDLVRAVVLDKKATAMVHLDTVQVHRAAAVEVVRCGMALHLGLGMTLVHTAVIQLITVLTIDFVHMICDQIHVIIMMIDVIVVMIHRFTSVAVVVIWMKDVIIVIYHIQMTTAQAGKLRSLLFVSATMTITQFLIDHTIGTLDHHPSILTMVVDYLMVLRHPWIIIKTMTRTKNTTRVDLGIPNIQVNGKLRIAFIFDIEIHCL